MFNALIGGKAYPIIHVYEDFGELYFNEKAKIWYDYTKNNFNLGNYILNPLNTNYLEDPLFFMESIPSRETRWFIEKILTKYWIYQNKNNK